jgi:NitT/TauT family transport system permease protein
VGHDQGTLSHPGRRRLIPKNWRLLLSVVVVAAAWQFVATELVTSHLVFASLSSIFAKAWQLAQSGKLWTNVRVSGLEFVLGYSAAVVLGVALGIVLALGKTFREFAEPWINALYATPMIAIAPIFIVLLGIGIYSKIVIVFIEAFFPIAVTTAVGIRSTERVLIEAAESFGASRMQVIRTVLLPNAYAFIIAGMRIAVARGLAGVLISEIFGSVAGIGNMIWFSAENYDMPSLFTGVFILAGTSIGLMAILARIERKVAPWRS